MNSERIRDNIQNCIHDGMSWIFQGRNRWYKHGMDIPHFLMRPDLSPSKAYLNYGITNPYSLY